MNEDVPTLNKVV